jgi:hypothetical protein
MDEIIITFVLKRTSLDIRVRGTSNDRLRILYMNSNEMTAAPSIYNSKIAQLERKNTTINSTPIQAANRRTFTHRLCPSTYPAPKLDSLRFEGVRE